MRASVQRGTEWIHSRYFLFLCLAIWLLGCTSHEGSLSHCPAKRIKNYDDLFHRKLGLQAGISSTEMLIAEFIARAIPLSSVCVKSQPPGERDTTATTWVESRRIPAKRSRKGARVYLLVNVTRGSYCGPRLCAQTSVGKGWSGHETSEVQQAGETLEGPLWRWPAPFDKYAVS